MKSTGQEHVFSAHLSNACTYHARMLADQNRNLAIKAALEKYLGPSKSFLDVGSGTGIWAIYGALLGAEHVVAVETEETLIPIIRRHAEENGVADKIEIFHGNVNDLEAGRKFDVVLSELFGNDIYGEPTTRAFIRLRKQFLAAEGVLLPQKMELFAVPLRISRPAVEFPLGVHLKMEFLNSLRQNYSKILTLSDRKDLDFAAEPKLLTTLDYLTIEEPPPILPLSAEWDVDDIRLIDAFLCFTVTKYGAGIELNSLGSSTWLLERFDLAPFDVDSGTISFSLTMDPTNPVWSVRLASHPSIAGQTYSPVFAFTRAKLALAGTPHTKLEGKESND